MHCYPGLLYWLHIFDRPVRDEAMLPPKNDHLILDFSGPPPDFTLYDAEFFEVGYEDIVSHDPHLNTDGQ